MDPAGGRKHGRTVAVWGADGGPAPGGPVGGHLASGAATIQRMATGAVRIVELTDEADAQVHEMLVDLALEDQRHYATHPQETRGFPTVIVWLVVLVNRK